MVLIFAADQGTEARIRAALRSAGYPASIVNTLVIPASMLTLGIGPTADQLVLLGRNAKWADPASGKAYMDSLNTPNSPTSVFRVTPRSPAALNPFPAPRPRVRGAGKTEMDLMGKLGDLRQAIIGSNAGLYFRDYTMAPEAYDGYDYLQRAARGAYGDTRDVYASSATYSMFFGERNTGIPNDWGNTGSGERGPSDFYQRHRFVTRGIVELPHGLELSLVGLVASGLPVNPVTGVDNNGDTQFADRPAGFGRNSFRAPLEQSLDASVSREFALREQVKLDVRVEAFNVLNRSNYVKVNGVYGDGTAPSPSFLKPIAGVTNVNPARQFQFALRLWF